MRRRHYSLLGFALSAAVVLAGAGYIATVQNRVGPEARGGGAHRVATGQRVRPAGDVLSLPQSRPVDAALSPDETTLYVKDNRGVVRVDAATWKQTGFLKFPAGGGSMHGIAVSQDGRRVYATNSGNLLAEATVGADGALTWARQIALSGPKGAGASYPCGVALSADGRTAYVCLSRNNTLAVVDLDSGKVTREIPVGVAPYDAVLSADGTTAYVSNWGGRMPRPGEAAAPSSGTPVLIDKRGIAQSGTVSRIDLKAGRETAQADTGLHPSDLALSPDGKTLYVANANSDSVSALTTADHSLRWTFPVKPDPSLPFGSAPNALALSPDGKRLYVACGGNNAVALVRLDEDRPSVGGWVPAGWYPAALALAQDGARIFVASAKGLGSRSQPNAAEKGWSVYSYTGTVQRVTLATGGSARAEWTRQVREDALVPQALAAAEKARSGVKPVPVPERAGEPSVFEHVIYIIKENRTYDQILADLPQGNGDKSLCVFPRAITPNHHALAEEFVLLDNYYCNGVLSADGHSWATEGNVTDHLEKSFGGFTRSYTFGDDPLTYSSSGFLWDGALARGLSVRNYGEMDYTNESPAGTYWEIEKDWKEKSGKFTFSHNIGIENLKRYSCPDAPGWNMDIPDRMRADVFLRELADFEKRGAPLPNLIILYLPNDHTEGTKPGAPTPAAYLADNDLALGQIIEAVSNSRYWPKTCIFVNEDDPQAGFDHVDGHRSLCLVISPYTKRGKVVSQFFNQTSVLHTMERMLGLPAMNQMDAGSSLMRDCFITTADLRPYVCKPVPDSLLSQRNPPAAALSGKARHWAEVSASLNCAQFDRAPEDTLNRIVWHAMKGADTPYPAHLAGAHGRGLKPLGRAPDLHGEDEDEDD